MSICEVSGGEHVCEAQQLSRENVCEFRSFVTIHKVFSAKFWGVASLGVTKASNLQKFSARKLYFSLIRESFHPRKFSTILSL